MRAVCVGHARIGAGKIHVFEFRRLYEFVCGVLVDLNERDLVRQIAEAPGKRVLRTAQGYKRPVALLLLRRLFPSKFSRRA